MRVDVQGAATIRRLVPEAVLIFMMAPTLEELAQRLYRRGQDSPEQLQTRLETAQTEMARMEEFDYVVINRNDALDDAVDDVIAIIRAEHCRVHPRRIVL